MKLLYTLVFLLLTSIVYSQKSTLYPNVNVRAKEVKQYLNTSGDSLILRCDRTIYEVVIFNTNFERVIKVKETDAIIPISDVPVGRYIVEVVLSDKLIVITLLRNEPFNLPEMTPLVTDNSGEIAVNVVPETQVFASVEPQEIEESADLTTTSEESFGEENNIKRTNLAVPGKKRTPIRQTTKVAKKEAKVERKNSITSSLSLFTPNEKSAKKATRSNMAFAKSNRIVSTYWVVYKINNGQSSEKIQKMSDQDAVDRLIKKNEIDMNTKSGQLNELTVWTVYDPSKFVQHKKRNKEDFMHIASESFKSEPYYKRVN